MLGDQSSRFRYVYPTVEGYSGGGTGRWTGDSGGKGRGEIFACSSRFRRVLSHDTPFLSSVLAGDIAATMPEARTLAGKASIG
ncbi:Uncharacterized protein DBV15_06718 [Temnothorax longispinosus]|uniref:Uncharacterized protein n=1 Tax=Temnothorax longispinosus TaxID=300112 RepID=A0A4S2JSI2_9HYME|nr:Uncharacterized protein DBV15_06718 [Temnothorax longispinosus]